VKVVILAGGFGTRLAEETDIKPKPMVEIGGRPILWHIMMHYDFYGFKHFVFLLGYKGEVIKRYLVDFCSGQAGQSESQEDRNRTVSNHSRKDWTVELLDTGIHTQTGGRLKRFAAYSEGKTFMLTYGDGVSDVNLQDLWAFHRSHGKLATVTAVRPPTRFGYMKFDGDKVVEFKEKPSRGEGWINGAYFVLEPEVLDYIADDRTVWEKEPLEQLAADGQLMAFRHTSFWQCMDTLYEKRLLEFFWQSGNAPWKIWK